MIFNSIFNFKTLELETLLINKFGFQTSFFILQELLTVGLEYSTLIPLSISLESFKGCSYLSPFFFKQSFSSTTKNHYMNTNKINDFFLFSKFFQWFQYFYKINSFYPSIHFMVTSSSRANLSQLYQLIGLRGYLTSSSGEIKKIPVMSSFSNGLKTFEFFLSCYGTRKGVLDTALKTANSGYLTKKLVETSLDLLIKEKYCGTTSCVELISNSTASGVSSSNEIVSRGKILAKDIISLSTGMLIKKKNTVLVDFNGISINKNTVKIYTSKTCLCSKTICNFCLGFLGKRGFLAGEAFGVFVGESLGEPITQMTLRTFHTGGVISSNLKKKVDTVKKFKFSIFHKCLIQYKKNSRKTTSFYLIITNRNGSFTNFSVNNKFLTINNDSIHFNYKPYYKKINNGFYIKNYPFFSCEKYNKKMLHYSFFVNKTETFFDLSSLFLLIKTSTSHWEYLNLKQISQKGSLHIKKYKISSKIGILLQPNFLIQQTSFFITSKTAILKLVSKCLVS